MLARWSGWGAVPKVFDEADQHFAAARAELKTLLKESEWRAAAKTTLNAHYTDAALAAVMWDAVRAGGLAGGSEARPVRVLEPGCGAGTFLGLAPDDPAIDLQLIGVELDSTTAAIARHLYPHADIRTESFADTQLPDSFLDLVIGNVPFGKIALHDKTHNPAGHSLHNHFILKSLALTRPGGVVAVLTSHYTMDSINPAARRDMADCADLITAIRLPISAHQRAAGTQVITDLLVLRRRDPAGGPGDITEWDGTVRIGGDEQREVCVNRYFAEHHPERVIGLTGTRSGQFGPELDVTVVGQMDVAEALRARLVDSLHDAAGGDPAWSLFAAAPADTPIPRLAPAALAGEYTHHQQDHIDVDGHGGFTIVDRGALVPHQVPTSQAKELSALLGLRDTTVALLAAEAASAADTDQIDQLRHRLNRQYDVYLTRFGPINRISWRRTGRVNEVSGEDKLARTSPPHGRFRLDPHSPAVYALEDFDAITGTARKAPIFTGRVVAPRLPRRGADTPADAVAICLDTHGEVRLDEVAHLLGRSEADTRKGLDGLVFADPDQPERLIPAPEYLSGDVRAKLAAAEAAADRDMNTADGGRRWDANIAALRDVLPPDLTPAEIDARLGASWIDANTVQEFLRELLADQGIAVEHPGGSTWGIKATNPAARHSVLATSAYGTERLSALDIAHALLEQRQIRIFDELDDGRRIPNLTETVAAQEKAGAITERFSEWIWDDPERAATLSRRYNDMFNNIVLRSYDGAHMQLPGLAVTFTPHQHQLAAVARIVAEPAVLLAHEVGAGKTASMAIGAMELRRLGMANKPCVVVPNHMLEQFTREWMQLYPQARILAASIDDLAKDKRRRLVARVATGDWDAVIVSRSAFERIPLSAAAQKAYLDAQLDDMRHQLDASKRGRGLTVKRLEGALARAEERIKRLTDSVKDPGITFEQTGIDYLFCDEAHGYKNLATVSNIPGAAVDGAQRASDLDMKLAYLRGRHGRRVATFATATPIANSVTEAYTMQRYLRPDLLQNAGLTDFDTWAATFGEVTTSLELAPDGSRFRMQARFAKFRNVPELLRMWHVSADIKTAEDLHLPTPALRGGDAETVVVPGNEQLAEFMAELSARADAVQARAVDPAKDNMLKVATHGRLAALDLRLVDRDPGDNTKLAGAADRIAAIYHANISAAYPDSDVTGALQIVFCDLGTPQVRTRSTLPGTGQRWNAYHELKELLVDRGVPASQVRFMHDAKNDKEKAELFAAARNGRVSVIIGSTEKMGVGTNVQQRAIALHHVDCPWRPADIAQREGRLLRQGNLNPEVEVIRYVTQSSFDAYLWQTVERKARFIAQVMRGTLDVREIEDIGDSALSYAEVKALATGDPRILEKAKLDAEVTRLERLERSHTRNRRALSATITAAEQQLARLQDERDQAAEAATRAIDTSGDRFSMTVNGTRWTTRADAAIALRHALAAIGSPDRMPGTSWDKPHHVATIGGFNVDATPRRLLQPHLSLQLAGVPRSGITVDFDELRSDRPIGIITRLENRADDVDRLLVRIDTEISGLTAEADRARSQYSQPFTHRDALAVARQRSAELTDQLARTDDDTAAPAPTSTGAQADTGTPATATATAEHTRTPAPKPTDDEVTRRRNDAARWPSVQAFPTGTEVTVHAADADGTGRQLGHGKVVGHPGPEHVIVESPWGTRRTATLSCVRPAPATQHAHTTDSAPTTRWAPLLDQQHPTVTADPHWPALAALLDRIDRAGGDVPALIDQVTRGRGLPTDNPARSLDYRLSDTVPALPHTDGRSYEPSTVAAPPRPAWPPRPTLPPGLTPPR